MFKLPPEFKIQVNSGQLFFHQHFIKSFKHTKKLNKFYSIELYVDLDPVIHIFFISTVTYIHVSTILPFFGAVLQNKLQKAWWFTLNTFACLLLINVSILIFS